MKMFLLSFLVVLFAVKASADGLPSQPIQNWPNAPSEEKSEYVRTNVMVEIDLLQKRTGSALSQKDAEIFFTYVMGCMDGAGKHAEAVEPLLKNNSPSFYIVRAMRICKEQFQSYGR